MSPLLADASMLATSLIFPLGKMLFVMGVSLFAATLIESLQWTRHMERLASPLIRLAHMHEASGASFSLAFVSPSASNALLANAYGTGAITRRELVLANLVNSTPTFLMHLPSMLSMAFTFLGSAALPYIFLTFAAALLRTGLTVAAGRLLLAGKTQQAHEPAPPKKEFTWNGLLKETWKRCKKRLSKMIAYTIPCYVCIFAMQKAGWFIQAEQFMAAHANFLTFLRPETFGIISLSLLAESTASFAAAAPLLHAGTISATEAVTALLAGNIISSPMRAFRHQFPAYAGYFSPPLAFLLVSVNQICRAGSLIFVLALYLAWQ